MKRELMMERKMRREGQIEREQKIERKIEQNRERMSRRKRKRIRERKGGVTRGERERDEGQIVKKNPKKQMLSRRHKINSN